MKKGKGKRALSTREHVMPKKDTDDDIDMGHSQAEDDQTSKRKRALST